VELAKQLLEIEKKERAWTYWIGVKLFFLKQTQNYFYRAVENFFGSI
jgi:hypothetical protein